MATKKNKDKTYFRGIYWALNMFTTFIYSLFAHGRVMDKCFGDNSLYESSVCNQVLDKTARSLHRGRFTRTVEWLIEKSVSLQVLGAIRAFLARISFSVYGVFFCVFGLTTVFIYYTVLLLTGNVVHGISSVAVAAVIVVCSIPMMMSQRAVSSYISESRILRRVAISFLGIPEEKLKSGKRLGGSGYMFFAAVLGIVCGGLTYFWHPSYLPIAILIVIAVCLISANPETGVLLTLAAVPFLQYTDMAELILVILILVTSLAYVSKLLKHRRTISYTAESVMILIFCGFILVASLFSPGGYQSLLEAVFVVIVILGGFFTTYNLMSSERLLNACVRIIAVSFSILALVGLWNVIYDAVVDGVMYSMREYVQPIFEGNNIYIADSAEVFGVFAVIAFPLVFSRLARSKNAPQAVWSLIFLALLMAAVFIYGTYETVIALTLEFCLFWILYSHKTLNVVLISLIPLGIVAILYPYIANFLGIQNLGEEIRSLLPLSFPDAPTYREVVNDTIQMLVDGNLTGIGVGKHAYTVAMKEYADAISIGADSPTSFWLQVLCWSGIGGLITFAIFLILLFRNGVGYLASSRDKEIRINTLALFCGMAALLVFGCFNCIWSDLRMLYLFWAAMGLFVGYLKEGRGRERKLAAELMRENDYSDADLRFYD